MRISLWVRWVVVFCTGLFLVYLGSLGDRKVPVLCFHRILESDRDSGLDWSEARFFSLLDQLAATGWKTVLPGENIPWGKYLILSFDDGSPEHFLKVMPELKRRGMKGLFFWPSRRLLDLSLENQSLLRQEAVFHGIGSHATHNISLLENIGRESVTAILDESKNTLEKFFGRSMDSFAFPQGDFDAFSSSEAGKRYHWLFSVDYEWFRPSVPLAVHGRFMVSDRVLPGEIIDYLEESIPFEGWVFWLELLILALINLLVLSCSFFAPRKRNC